LLAEPIAEYELLPALASFAAVALRRFKRISVELEHVLVFPVAGGALGRGGIRERIGTCALYVEHGIK
jgi:hypothetical protein